MTNAPQHTPLAHWPVVDDSLVVGGVTLARIAQRAGRTPFYVYDRAVIDSRIALLRRHFPAEVKLHYAIKANPMPALVCHVARGVDGLDVASGAELKIALDAGMPPAEVSFAGPAKSDTELAQAVASGILINVESMREIVLLARISSEVGMAARVAVRINPDFELKSSGMRMSGGPKQFGIDAEAIPDVLHHIARHRLAFEGFHIFSGSQNLRADAICEAHQSAVELALRLAGDLPVRTINIGGGLGIPYFPGDEPLDVAPIAANLQALLPDIRRRMPQAEVVLELGRYLVGEAGVYVCKVIDRKISRGQVFLITDGGLHHHLAASGNFGQVLRKNYPVIVGEHVVGKQRENASVVGPLCTPLDVLGDRMDLARAEEGDLIVVLQSGAYGFSSSPRSFLSHPEPAEILL